MLTIEAGLQASLSRLVCAQRPSGRVRLAHLARLACLLRCTVVSGAFRRACACVRTCARIGSSLRRSLVFFVCARDAMRFSCDASKRARPLLFVWGPRTASRKPLAWCRAIVASAMPSAMLPLLSCWRAGIDYVLRCLELGGLSGEAPCLAALLGAVQAVAWLLGSANHIAWLAQQAGATLTV